MNNSSILPGRIVQNM